MLLGCLMHLGCGAAAAPTVSADSKDASARSLTCLCTRPPLCRSMPQPLLIPHAGALQPQVRPAGRCRKGRNRDGGEGVRN